MIEIGIIDLLLGEQTVTAVVGTRITPLLLPTEPVVPAITFQIVSGKSMATLTDPGMRMVRLQIDCWGSTYLDAATARDAVVTFLDQKRGALSDGSYLHGAELIQPLDFFSGGDELFRAGAEFSIFYAPPA